MREEIERQEIEYGIAMVMDPTWFCMDRCILPNMETINYHAHAGDYIVVLKMTPASKLLGLSPDC